jgi:uncharacterized LabA/DUF88 family protein
VSKNVAVFVDVANIFYAAKAAGVDIDYVTLLKSATANRDLVRAYAYTGLDPENENQRNFHSFLARSGYRVVSKDIRKYGDGKVKANLDIELVVDMMKTARNLDIAIVVSGDGDFAPAIRAVQEQGVRVEVISFRGNTSSDLMDVADLFTDITHLAKVEKGSRSGRRVAGDDEDLSMTEVPDKQTEGTGAGRSRGGRGRERSRTRDVEPVSRGGRGGGTRREAPAAVTSSGAPLVVLPGERLSRAPSGDAPSAPALLDDEAGVAADEAEGALAAFAGETNGETDEAGERRRRRRRGGRGRGRGRGRGEGETGETGETVEPVEARGTGSGTSEVAAAAPFGEDEDVEDIVATAPRGPRTTPFGSVWDTQLGVPSSLPSGPGTMPPPDDEDFDEPEIPEYLIAEQRRNSGNRGGRGPAGQGGRGGRGARSGYAAAVERERYGRGGGGGINRYPDVSARERQARDTGYGRSDRPARPQPRPERQGGARGGGEWSEVPPEIEEMLRAQLASRPKSVAPAAPEAAPETMSEATTAPKRRTTRRRTTGTADAAAPTTGAKDAGGMLAEAEAQAKRRTTRRTTKATADAAPPDAPADESTATEAPKRRTTRRTTKATADTATPAASGDNSTATEAPKRRTTRRKATTEPTDG